jgi:hypothetical protein
VLIRNLILPLKVMFTGTEIALKLIGEQKPSAIGRVLIMLAILDNGSNLL